MAFLTLKKHMVQRKYCNQIVLIGLLTELRPQGEMHPMAFVTKALIFDTHIWGNVSCAFMESGQQLLASLQFLIDF